MTFLFPLGLLALLALPVIILLHLRRERLRRVVVPSLLLWQHIAPTTGKEQKRMLPITLLLLLHLFIATLLALALGRPQWLSSLLGSSEQHSIVVVDTSTSMAAQESFAGTRLDQARAHVQGLIDGMGFNDTISLIAASSQSHFLTTGGPGDRAGLLAALDTLEATGTGTDIAGALTLARVVHQSDPRGQTSDEHIVVISDMEPPEQTALPEDLEWVRVGDTTSNQAIVTLSAEPQHGGTSGYDVYARVVNYDSDSAFTTLRLTGDGQPLDTRTIDLQGNGESELTWSLPPGIRMLHAEIDGGDALSVDDTADLSLLQTRPINVVLVSEPSESLNRVLNVIPSLNIAVVPPADYLTSPQAANADLTIFNNTLPESWPIGGVLVINPPAGEHPLLTVEAAPPAEDPALALPTQTSLTIVDEESALLQGLSLGSVDFGPLPRVQPPDWARTLLMAEDRPLILQGRSGESEIAIWAFNLASGNVTSKLAFPLLVARTVQSLTPPPPPASLLVGQALELQPNPRTDRVEVRGPDDQTQEMAASRTLVIEGFTQPGLYTLTEYAGEAIVYEGQLAINAGTSLESDLRPIPFPSRLPTYIAQDASPAAGATGAVPQPQSLWPWLALGALSMLVVEWLYVHWR